MNSHRKSRVSDDLNSKKPEGKEGVNSAEQTKRPVQTGVSSAEAVSKKRNGKGILSSDVPTKQIAGTARLATGLLIQSWSLLSHGTRLSDLNDSSVVFPKTGSGSIDMKSLKLHVSSKEIFMVRSHHYVGHMKLVNGQTLSDSLVLDEGEIASKRHILVHVQTHETKVSVCCSGPVMKLYLWDKAAVDFCKKFKAYENTPSVILVTTLNPKRLGDVANRVNADIVTKAETATIGELFSYMKQEGAKVAWFECTATIDDVVRGCAWYYIACVCAKLRQPKGLPLLCVRNVEKLKLLVLQSKSYIDFCASRDAGHELTGRQASELVESYFEANESVGVDHVVPVPQALIDTIGQTHKFVVKETSQLGNREDGPSVGNEESADGAVKRSSDGIESAEAKRAKGKMSGVGYRKCILKDTKPKGGLAWAYNPKLNLPTHVPFLRLQF
ncbi:hypothetical protein Bca101_083660 [Brassica carinata]